MRTDEERRHLVRQSNGVADGALLDAVSLDRLVPFAVAASVVCTLLLVFLGRW